MYLGLERQGSSGLPLILEAMHWQVKQKQQQQKQLLSDMYSLYDQPLQHKPVLSNKYLYLSIVM